MPKCYKCSKNILKGSELTCSNCGAKICDNCAKNTLKICPFCYHDLEYSG